LPGVPAPVSVSSRLSQHRNNHQRAGENGLHWFQSLGAAFVTVLSLVDHASANEKDIVEALARSRFIYMLGGFPHYLAQTLTGSLSWRAILTAHGEGAVIAGSSAGAMVLCEYYYDPAAKKLEKGLNLIPGACVLPHYNTFGQSWAAELGQILPEIVFIGIDEETGMINNGPQGQWQVYGKGAVTLHRRRQCRYYRGKATFSLNY